MGIEDDKVAVEDEALQEKDVVLNKKRQNAISSWFERNKEQLGNILGAILGIIFFVCLLFFDVIYTFVRDNLDGPLRTILLIILISMLILWVLGILLGR